MSTRREFLLRASIVIGAPALSCRSEEPSGEPRATSSYDPKERSPNMSVQLSRVISAGSKSIGSIFSVSSLEFENERSPRFQKGLDRSNQKIVEPSSIPLDRSLVRTPVTTRFAESLR